MKFQFNKDLYIKSIVTPLNYGFLSQLKIGDHIKVQLYDQEKKAHYFIFSNSYPEQNILKWQGKKDVEEIFNNHFIFKDPETEYKFSLTVEKRIIEYLDLIISAINEDEANEKLKDYINSPDVKFVEKGYDTIEVYNTTINK